MFFIYKQSTLIGSMNLTKQHMLTVSPLFVLFTLLVGVICPQEKMQFLFSRTLFSFLVIVVVTKGGPTSIHHMHLTGNLI